jgi:transposase-like protein
MQSTHLLYTRCRDKSVPRCRFSRMAVIPDFKKTTLGNFIKTHVATGTTIYTDGLKSFTGLQEAGFRHIPRTQPVRSDLSKGAKSAVPLADRAIGNRQQWLIGTYHGVSRGQSGVYFFVPGGQNGNPG